MAEPRVLVADDSALIQRVTLRQLQALGIAAVAVGDGQAAVDACRDGAFDVVLMDVHMPLLDGLAATREILRAGAPAPRIVGLTGSPGPDERDACLQAGMSAVLVKPPSLDDLRAALST
jgi:CheY-like chemotaxis protein